ncbi:hypothetical protein CFP56_001139 [Quercus suber]|uniref:Uncharacterized protein n=1 Tax=Quercus suber TaxID=58331 RepID=A0AAW0IMX5_QUESU
MKMGSQFKGLGKTEDPIKVMMIGGCHLVLTRTSLELLRQLDHTVFNVAPNTWDLLEIYRN